MGFTEFLTIVFIVLKCIGIIDWSWWIVLFPEIIASTVYIALLVAYIGVTVRLHRENKKFMKRMWEDE